MTFIAASILLWRIFRNRREPDEMDENAAAHAAKRIALRDGYYVRRIWRVFPGVPETEVLFTGRFKGDARANIPADPEGEELPYRVWVREDGSGYVTVGW